LSLWNPKENLAYHIPFALAAMADKNRWRITGEMENGVIYENRLVRQRAWLVPYVFSSNQVLNIIKTSKMPNGQLFHPWNTALVEDSFNLKSKKDRNSEVFLKDISNDIVEVSTKSAYPAFLVLSDIHYPGWKAWVDGKETYIHRTNYAFRGVSVPAGQHLIRFEYKPTSLYCGAAVSILSLFIFAIITGRQFIITKKLTV
jgi:hypothetical protein